MRVARRTAKIDRPPYKGLRGWKLLRTQTNHSDMTVRIYGTTGVVMGRTVNEGDQGDRDVSGDFRHTRIYGERDGRWQAVLAPYSRIVGIGK